MELIPLKPLKYAFVAWNTLKYAFIWKSQNMNLHMQLSMQTHNYPKPI